MEVVVATAAIRRAKLQSNHYHQQINTQRFTGRMPFLSPNQQCQSTKGKSAVKTIFWSNQKACILVRCWSGGCSRWCRRPLCTTTKLSSPPAHTVYFPRMPSVESRPTVGSPPPVWRCHSRQTNMDCLRQFESVTSNKIMDHLNCA